MGLLNLKTCPDLKAVLCSILNDPGATSKSKSVDNPEVDRRQCNGEECVGQWKADQEPVCEGPCCKVRGAIANSA